MNAVDELLLHFGREYWLPENLPPSRHRGGGLLEEVLDAALAAAEMVEHHIAHDAPTQARSPAQRGVHVLSADDAFGDEVIDLPRQGRLQTVGHMPWHLLAQADGLIPRRRGRPSSGPFAATKRRAQPCMLQRAEANRGVPQEPRLHGAERRHNRTASCAWRSAKELDRCAKHTRWGPLH